MMSGECLCDNCEVTRAVIRREVAKYHQGPMGQMDHANDTTKATMVTMQGLMEMVRQPQANINEINSRE